MTTFKNRSSARTEFVQVAFLISGLAMLYFAIKYFHNAFNINEKEVIFLLVYISFALAFIYSSFKIANLKSHEKHIQFTRFLGKNHNVSIKDIHFYEITSFRLSLFDPLNMSRFSIVKYDYEGKLAWALVLNQSSFSGKISIEEILKMIRTKYLDTQQA